MSADSVRHPIFARLYTKFSRSMEPEIGPYRAQLVAGLTGRVLEVGAGNGMNFAHYGDGIEELVALEPESYLRTQASRAAAAAKPPVTLLDGNALNLPFADDSFDQVIFCLVLCSIEDPAAALAEAKRVLKPGGSVRFLEHVGSARPAKARFQRFLDRSRIWPTIAGGCHCSRETTATISAAGFDLGESRDITIGAAWAHTNPHVIGFTEPV